jgi:hypothetical protein
VRKEGRRRRRKKVGRRLKQTDKHRNTTLVTRGTATPKKKPDSQKKVETECSTPEYSRESLRTKKEISYEGVIYVWSTRIVTR